MSLKRKYSNEPESGGNGEVKGKTGSSNAVSPSSSTIFSFFSHCSSRNRPRPNREMKPFPTLPVPKNYIAIYNLLLQLPCGLIEHVLTAAIFVISHRPQLHQNRRVQNGRGLTHLPPLHHGLYLLPHRKYPRCRPGTPICTFALPAMRRSCPWRNSNIILSPITKRAGSPFNMASNDVFLASFPSHFPRPVTAFSFAAHSLPASDPRHLPLRACYIAAISIHFPSCLIHALALDPGRSWNIPSYRYQVLCPLRILRSHNNLPSVHASTCFTRIFMLCLTPLPPVVARFHSLNDETDSLRYVFQPGSVYRRTGPM